MNAINITPVLMIRYFLFVSVMLVCSTRLCSQPGSDSTKPLTVPILLKKEQRISGNPLATYAEMLALESRYLSSPLKEIFIEQKKNLEEFLGLPLAGVQAMHEITNLRVKYSDKDETLAADYVPFPVLDVMAEEAKTHNIIIWGEEHHLPQTRSLYSAMLSRLWQLGFRYLAAETFTPEVESPDFKNPGYNSGYYLMDPVFASAVRDALKLGYKLIAYDNNEKERDKKQAENIKSKIFDKDASAKVLIIAGRGHIAETIATGGWEPMGYWLKKLTGHDPFTMYAPTMTERLTREEEHPIYRYVINTHKLKEPVIFKNKLNKYFGESSFDTYVFFPRVKVVNGRPGWLLNLPGRKAVKFKTKLKESTAPFLLQIFSENDPDISIPADQFFANGPKVKVTLALPNGKNRLRIIDKEGRVLFQKHITH
jgi:hypothetical protein